MGQRPALLRVLLLKAKKAIGRMAAAAMAVAIASGIAVHRSSKNKNGTKQDQRRPHTAFGLALALPIGFAAPKHVDTSVGTESAMYILLGY